MQVCGDSNAILLRVAHSHKVAKYSQPEVLDYAMRMAGGDSLPTVSSITVSWRGIVARPTLLTLKHLSISKDFATLVAVRAISGSVSVYAKYMRTSGGGDVG